MIVKLLNEHHLEFLSVKGGCRGLSESTHVKMPHCWKSHATAHLLPSKFIMFSYPLEDFLLDFFNKVMICSIFNVCYKNSQQNLLKTDLMDPKITTLYPIYNLTTLQSLYNAMFGVNRNRDVKFHLPARICE